MMLKFTVTIDFDDEVINEAAVSEMFDMAVEDMYVTGVVAVTSQEASYV
jgi:hypothetical protein